MKIRILILLGLVMILSCTTEKPLEVREGRKFNPGHYVALNDREIYEIDYLDEPALIGVNKRYHWRLLEPEKGEYDFSIIEEDLDLLAQSNKQLIVFLIDRSFVQWGALPDYLSSYQFPLYDGQGVIRWHPEVVERYIALAHAMGEALDSHPNFEGVAIQETALDLTEDLFQQFEYSPEKYRDALIEILVGVQNALPNSNVFWYCNFMHQNDGHLAQVAEAVSRHGVIMGGPDILPYNRWHNFDVYPLYEEFKDRMILFCSAQDDSYMHHKNDLRVHQKEPLHPEGYLSMEEIFFFARDELHVSYVFWNYFYGDPSLEVRSFDDSIQVIREHPVF